MARLVVIAEEVLRLAMHGEHRLSKTPSKTKRLKTHHKLRLWKQQGSAETQHDEPRGTRKNSCCSKS
jgi:hypothetical protein